MQSSFFREVYDVKQCNNVKFIEINYDFQFYSNSSGKRHFCSTTAILDFLAILRISYPHSNVNCKRFCSCL